VGTDVGSSYFEGVFGPLKSTLVKELKINSMSRTHDDVRAGTDTQTPNMVP
jgi:hypothetical protein